ncbi:transcriptional regulator [Vibrio mediterranei]|uniref:LysR family transcriptional regulator n=1 Tax=Vibrio mediterranei TaxID=689 RepID=UPI000D17FCCB|nr:LysR family transcriptional regulator [Vibrio mediterranei]MCG9661270.1 LysR family transcriptional regulator [Vibrio mediterranei]MCG9662728.1 LysR family transcriptional regulator [Vibrio mediterranei]PTC05315.1 transcriptional regulator [Vibrio mediterranei]
MNKLRLMSIYVQIIESGSITKAADKLGVSKSVVSSALKQLENELNTSLLKRTTRKQMLTSTGERFYHQCALMLEQAESAWIEASESMNTPSGRLSVTAPHALMQSIVIPALTETFNDFSDVTLNLVSDDDHVDIIQQDIDLAIRVGASGDSNLKQRKLGQFSDVLCQSKNNEADITSCQYVAQHWQPAQIHHRELNTEQELTFVPAHRVNTIYDAIRLIERGFGIGLVPEFLVGESMAIKPVAEIEKTKPNPIYSLHPYQAHVPLTVSMAISAIEQRINTLLIDS